MPISRDPISLENLDAGSDNPAAARHELLLIVQRYNELEANIDAAEGVAALDADGLIKPGQLDLSDYLPTAGGVMTGPLLLDYEVESTSRETIAVNRRFFDDWQVRNADPISIVYVRYSKFTDGTDFTELPESSTVYVGFASGTVGAGPPAERGDYRWMRIKGVTGAAGARGSTGPSGPAGPTDSGTGNNGPGN